MQKLNILQPQDANIKGDKSLVSMYSKSYRQMAPSNQSTLRINYSKNNNQNSHKLQIGRAKIIQEK